QPVPPSYGARGDACLPTRSSSSESGATSPPRSPSPPGGEGEVDTLTPARWTWRRSRRAATPRVTALSRQGQAELVEETSGDPSPDDAVPTCPGVQAGVWPPLDRGAARPFSHRAASRPTRRRLRSWRRGHDHTRKRRLDSGEPHPLVPPLCPAE